MSYQAIKDLVGYALRTGLIEEYDRPWAVNELLKAMGMDAWEEPAETHERPLEDILKELLDDVPFPICHLYFVYRFLLSCHNKRPPMIFILP